MTKHHLCVTLPGGEKVPALGQGTWHMGEVRARAAEEAKALRIGMELGMTLIDTAEMYGSGGAEEVVARAAEGWRERLFIVSKVLPYNASREGAVAACEKSLKRLQTDRIDLYLLHWKGSVPFAETLEGFERLKKEGKIRYHGVSNLDRAQLAEWISLAGSVGVAANQILYNLDCRGPEWDLVPFCREKGIPVMAYTPLGGRRMLAQPRLGEIARRHRASPAQIALAWLLARGQTIVIPKAARENHVRENAGASEIVLDEEDFSALDRAFPPPRSRTELAMG